jgi:hypothetical protein
VITVPTPAPAAPAAPSPAAGKTSRDDDKTEAVAEEISWIKEAKAEAADQREAELAAGVARKKMYTTLERIRGVVADAGINNLLMTTENGQRAPPWDEYLARSFNSGEWDKKGKLIWHAMTFLEAVKQMSKLPGLLRDCVATNFGPNYFDKHAWKQKQMFLDIFVDYEATKTDWDNQKADEKPWNLYKIEDVHATQKLITPVVERLCDELSKFTRTNFYDGYMSRDRQVRDWDNKRPLSDEESARLRARVEKQVQEILDRLQQK